MFLANTVLFADDIQDIQDAQDNQPDDIYYLDEQPGGNQHDNQRNNEEAEPDSYQTPQTIFIGDKGKLVKNLNTVFFNIEDAHIPLDGMNEDKDIVIHNAEIKDGKLIIDFQIFKTGVVKLPPVKINISKGEGYEGYEISDMEVKVTSLIDSGASTALSPFKKPLNAPGTLWIIVFSVFIIILIITFTMLFLLNGGSFFVNLTNNIKKKYIIFTTRRAIKRLRLSIKKGTKDLQTALGEISTELRVFLDRYFNLNCRSMVPAEFLTIKLPEDAALPEKYSPEYFFKFFTDCDTTRFSGQNVSLEAVSATIDEVENFIKAAG